MEFEWDNAKAARVLKVRAIDFEDVVLIFDQPHIKLRSDKKGEERWLIVGMIAGECVTSVYTMREETIRIITARRSRKHEQEQFYARHA
jgi:uncharacterized protein